MTVLYHNIQQKYEFISQDQVNPMVQTLLPTDIVGWKLVPVLLYFICILAYKSASANNVHSI